MKKLLAVMLACGMGGSKAWAHTPEDGAIWVTTGPYLHQTYVPSHYGATLPADLGYGVLVEGDIDKNGGIEVGIIFMRKSYFQAGTPTFSERVRRLHIPLGYRHWWTSRWSTGLSLFSSYSMGDPEPYGTMEAQDSSAARRATQYGLDASVIWDVAIWKDYTLSLDGRLSIALDPKQGERSSHYGVLAGIKFKL